MRHRQTHRERERHKREVNGYAGILGMRENEERGTISYLHAFHVWFHNNLTTEPGAVEQGERKVSETGSRIYKQKVRWRGFERGRGGGRGRDKDTYLGVSSEARSNISSSSSVVGGIFLKTERS